MMLTENQTTDKSLSALVKNSAAYNAWANKQLIGFLQTKPAELMDREVVYSFPSIRLTLIHIWECQKFWLLTIKGEAFVKEEFTGSTEELFDRVLANSEEFSNYIKTLAEQTLQEDCEITTPWFSSNFAVFEYVQQVVIHSTYHRGQIITIGRQLGFTDAPMTDYNLYNIVK